MIPNNTSTETTEDFRILDATTGARVPLTMQRLILTGTLLPVGAHLRVRHEFVTEASGTQEVVYAFMLPRDGALRSFTLTGPSFSARSRLVPVPEAVEVYEKGLEDGHLAVQAMTYDDGLVNLNVGNVRAGEPVTVELEILAGVELRDDGFRFRFPFTIAPSYHREARATAISSGGVLELPEARFGDVLLPPFRVDARELHEIACFLDIAAPLEGLTATSPSHTVRVGISGGRLRVSLAPGAALPDRDLILDVTTERPSPFVLCGSAEDSRSHFAAVFPSTVFGATPDGRRNVLFLLDRSGSMDGEPLAQAHRALRACLAALDETDRFGIVAFGTVTERFRETLVPANRENRRAADGWLGGICAQGGTELASAVATASALLNEEGGDVLLLTDGQVFDTGEVLAATRRAGVRFHVLGIGAASQDRFVALLARETDGVSRFVTPGERVDDAALDLFASISRPVATNLTVEPRNLEAADLGPGPSHSVFAGTPEVIWGECGPGSGGSLVLTWDENGERRLELPLPEGDPATGEVIRLLRGARLITDLEAQRSDDPDEAAAARRTAKRLERRLRALSERFGLASREMALVTVVERKGDRPGGVPRTELVPVGLPAWMSLTGVFGDSVSSRSGDEEACMGFTYHCLYDFEPSDSHDIAPPFEPDLVELLGLLEPDGGLQAPEWTEPPDDAAMEAYRTLATLLLLLACFEAGSSDRSGPYRVHVTRMIAFLEARATHGQERARIEAVIRAVRSGVPIPYPEDDVLEWAASWPQLLAILLDEQPWEEDIHEECAVLVDTALATLGA